MISMDFSRLPESARDNVEQLAAEPPFETVRLFLSVQFGDAESFEEVRSRLALVARTNIRFHQRELSALERLIADPPATPGVLARLVAWDANWVLDDESDVGALQFLREIAQMLREVIEAAPPSAERWSEWPPVGL